MITIKRAKLCMFLYIVPLKQGLKLPDDEEVELLRLGFYT